MHGSCELLEPSEAQHLVLNLHSALGEPVSSHTSHAGLDEPECPLPAAHVPSYIDVW